ncbi:Hippocampus abundant transcript 1 protein [Hondaea fermentalgiana]|uniref:Hippocampus abundant transcript 1 protein n=1 Tax=Hondaea fermentalgiana TaxID=2315210 RepID=A0A2R5GE86_9STRA|nr:Hippocampus abundant transcript 1 protein [Hondaea fermentalgiana]|eukprot:GBG29257.1 Hippocampus abundant transcript 1 protein [Hondaea fermentalgiana]
MAQHGPDGQNGRADEAHEEAAEGQRGQAQGQQEHDESAGAYAMAASATGRAHAPEEPEEPEEPDDPGLRDDTRLCVSGGPSTLHMMPVIFIYTLQSMLLFSMMPSVAANWFAHCDPEEKDLDQCKPNFPTAQAITGAVDSVSNLCAFFSAALLGRLSDVYGRRPLLVIALLISCLPTVALVVTNGKSPYAYYSSVILAGILGNSNMGTLLMSLFNAYIADIYTVRVRTSQLGLLGGLAALGLVLGPVLAGVTSKLSVAQVALLTLGVNAALMVYIMTVVKESLPVVRRNKFTMGRTLNPLAPLKLLTQSSIMRWVALLYFLAMLPEAGVREIMLSYCDEVLDLDQAGAREFGAFIFATLGAMGFCVNVFVLPALERAKVHSSTILSISQVCNSLHMVIYASLHFFPYRGVVFANTLPTAFAMLINVSSNMLISSAMGASEQGFALGTLAAVGGLASVVGPFTFSQAFAYFSRTLNAPQVPFVAGSVIAAVAAILSIFGPLRELESTSKRILAPSHSRLYEEHPDLRDDVVSSDIEEPLLLPGARVVASAEER